MVDHARGAYFQTRNLLLALEAGEPYRIARALAFEVPFVATVGGPGHARVADLLRAAEPIARRTGNPHAIGLVHAATGVAEFLVGRWYKGLVSLDQAEEVFRERCTNTAWEQGSVVTFGIWSLWFLGDLLELGHRLPRRLREAEDRGDRVVATNLRTCVANNYWLLQDDPGEARRQAEDAIQSWSKADFHLQHVYDLIAQTQVDLYEGNDHAAHRRLLESWSGLSTSLSLRIQVIRVTLTDLRARAAIASARSAHDRALLLRLAIEAARSLEAEAMDWVDPLAATVRAGIAAVEADADGARISLDRAIRGFMAADMKLFAMAARKRYGEVLGGEEGAAIAGAATRWMREQGVLDPARMVEALVPGFG